MPPLNRQSDFSDSSQLDLMALDKEDASTSDESSFSESRPRVSFGSIQIREYNRVVGDHPDVKVGPPISIGWEFYEHAPQPLDEYDANSSSRKGLGLQRLSSITRKNLLHNVFGVPEEEIRLAEKEVQQILKQRERSKRQSKLLGGIVGDSKKQDKRRRRRALWGEALMKGLTAAAGAMMPPGMPMGGNPMSVY